MTLDAFQRGAWTPPDDDRLLLLKNPHFPGKDMHFSLIRPARRDLIGKVLSKTRIKRGPTLSIPNRDAVLFAGLTQRSYDGLRHLRFMYEAIARRPQFNYQIVMGMGDYDLEEFWLRHRPPNLTMMLANNLNFLDPRISYLPMGRDPRSIESFEKVQATPEKDRLCYCNFSVDTHQARKQTYELMRGKSFVEFEHMGLCCEYEMTQRDYLQKLSRSKFAVCPRGNAIDTYRMWESLHLGVIPIVVREALYHRELEDLPVMLIDSVEDYGRLTAEQLETTFQQMLHQPYDYSKLRLSTWLSKLQTGIEK